MIKKKWLLLFLALSCSSTQNINYEMLKDGHFQLYSHPEADDRLEESSDYKKIVIAGMNDFHGHLEPSKELAFNPSGPSTQYLVGGVEIISSYLKILKARYKNKFLLVDAGDMWSGTFLSNHFNGAPVIDFYNYLKIDAVVLGNHEFDFGPQRILRRNIKKSHYPHIVSNILNITTGKPVRWKGASPYLIKKVNGIKVGIIGATTTQTPNVSVKKNLRGLYFQNITDSIITTSIKLKKLGAQMVVLVAHAGCRCGNEFAKKNQIAVEKVNFDTTTDELCRDDDELKQILYQIPPGSIDAVVAGHTHSKIANFIANIPVIQSFAYGKYFGRMELFFDVANNRIDQNKTIIHQPTKFCHQFFTATQDCYGKDDSIDHNQMEPAKFLGLTIRPDHKAKRILAPYKKKIKAKKDEVIATIERPLPHSIESKSIIGNLIVDSMKDATRADFAMTNAKGIRGGLLAGQITFDDIFKIIPFENYLVKVELNGHKLKELIKISTSGYSFGQASFSGLDILITDNPKKIKSRDLNMDGKYELWERDRLIEVKTAEGRPIEDNKSYTLVTNDFIGVNGGDGFAPIFNNIPKKKKNVRYDHSYRNVLVNSLKLQIKNPRAFQQKMAHALKTRIRMLTTQE